MSGLELIIAFFSSFILAQGLKTLAAVRRGEKNIKKVLLASGGMPSGHSAGICAVTILVGLIEGFDSSLFGLSVVMAAIIIYDSVNVRFAVGEQGKILNGLSKKKTKIIEGHTWREVAGGMMLGMVVGGLIYLVFN